MLTVVKNKSVPKTYLLKDKEACIVETSEIDGANVLPRDILSLANGLQPVPHDVGKLSKSNVIRPKYAQSYSRRVVERVNK